jgi:hypothetical protein
MKTFLFHADHGARCFDLSIESQPELELEGWRDTPFAEAAGAEISLDSELEALRIAHAKLEADFAAGMAFSEAQAARIVELEALVADLEATAATLSAANRPARGRKAGA